MEGQLTATLQLEAADYGLVRRLLPMLERRAGRLLANGLPPETGRAHGKMVQ